MKASEVFERLSLTIGYKIVNEQSFDVFMLSESKCDFKACIFIDSKIYKFNTVQCHYGDNK